jgi:molybdate transport system substrate-binding protein
MHDGRRAPCRPSVLAPAIAASHRFTIRFVDSFRSFVSFIRFVHSFRAFVFRSFISFDFRIHTDMRPFRHFAASLLVLAGLSATSAAHAADVVVSAAASLTNAFKELGAAFQAQHAGAKILSNFGASDVVLQQIVNGAPADVFASADEATMDKAVQAKVVDAASRKDFASNALVLIVPADSKLGITKVGDVSQADVKRITYGNPASVPVGRYTQGVLEQAGLWSAVQGKAVVAENVRQALDYVARGEVDAGFVYATDAAIMKDKVKVVVTVPTTQPVTYPIALTTRGAGNADARAFVAYVLAPAGQAVLAKYGFQKP